MLSLFAVSNPQAIKMTFQKVTDFIWFLQSCMCYHDKSKEAESFSIIEGSPYTQHSIINALVYTQTLIHRATFYILQSKGLV